MAKTPKARLNIQLNEAVDLAMRLRIAHTRETISHFINKTVDYYLTNNIGACTEVELTDGQLSDSIFFDDDGNSLGGDF